jgi:hypothetical protein
MEDCATDKIVTFNVELTGVLYIIRRVWGWGVDKINSHSNNSQVNATGENKCPHRPTTVPRMVPEENVTTDR